MVWSCLMNIIDTKAENTLRFLEAVSIKNIPLFKLEPINYKLENHDFTEIIFQSSPAVDFFKDHALLANKQIYSMGQATSATLESKGLASLNPKSPSSEGLIELLEQSRGINPSYLVVKGQEGLTKISDYLIKRGLKVKEIACYKRIKFESYENIRENFYKADAIIFPSNFSAEIYFQEIHCDQSKAIFFGISNRIINSIHSLGYKAHMLDYFSDDLENSIKKTISSL